LIWPAEPPVPERDPSEQAEFWLSEADRILQADPNDAALAMGAAVVLDSPSNEYLDRHTVIGSHFGQPALVIPNKKTLQIDRAKFEAKCRTRCLALAQRAMELDPTNVEWPDCAR
jgi:hypothetical protein